MLTPSPSITSAIRDNRSTYFNERKPETIVDTIVIHTMHCIEPECGELFSAEANKLVLDKHQVSAHYIVDREGLIWRLVSDDKRAWHAGVSKLPFADDAREGVNEFSIGVECLATQESGVTDAQYKSLALLCRNISEHYPIRNIVGHSDIAPGRKTDPWVLTGNTLVVLCIKPLQERFFDTHKKFFQRTREQNLHCLPSKSLREVHMSM